MKLILCIVVADAMEWLTALHAGYAALLDGNAAILISGQRFELEVCAADPRIPEAFRVSACRVHPSLDEEDFEALEGHGAVIYAVSDEYTTDDAAFATSQAALTVAAIAADAGALGIKCESSGLAHHPRKWIALQQQVADAMRDRLAGHRVASASLFGGMIEAFVRLPILSGRTLHTCGMHLLGRPEVGISRVTDVDAARWLQAFSLYQIAECAPADLADGQGFRLQSDGPRRHLNHVLDPGWYTPDDLFHNAWGAWLLDEAPGSRGPQNPSQ